jgi:lysozyme family protein
MTTDNFERAFQIVVGIEAGYVNDPEDPGGETKYGISKRAYPNEDIKNMTLERAKNLYIRDYWLRCHCDKLAWPWAISVFDCAVNEGQPTALHMLAKFQGNLIEFLAERGVQYGENKKFSHDGRGWMRRLITITIQSQKEG